MSLVRWNALEELLHHAYTSAPGRGGAALIGNFRGFVKRPDAALRRLRSTTSSDTNRTGDVIVLERQTPTDAAFYLVEPDSALVRVAYLDEGAPVKRWVAIGAALEESQ